jgi:hypothetical protein
VIVEIVEIVVIVSVVIVVIVVIVFLVVVGQNQMIARVSEWENWVFERRIGFVVREPE